jgi:histidine triad (HIT) family protein
MNTCVFCKIVAGKVPSYKVYEDELFIGFLDIFPVSKGHTLLIPKKHYRWTYDVPEFGKYWEAALSVTKMLEKGLSPLWVQYATHGEISHAHIHVIPRHDVVEGAPQVANGGKPLSFSKDELKAIQDSLTTNY